MTVWKEYKLGEIAEITSSKRIFYSEYVPDGVPFYRSKEIIDLYNKRSVSSELFITETRFDEIKDKFGVPQENDILLTSVGSLGIPYKVKKNDRFYFKDGNLTWFKDINREFLLPDYLMFWLRSSIGKQKLDEITIGSTQAALTISGLKTITIELPSIGEQKSIVSILSSLDDKIDLLHRENSTLEQMAETMFRQWFVVEAKEEWEEVLLGNVVKTTSGGTPSRKHSEYYENGTINWVKSKELNGSFISATEELITKEAVAKSSAKMLPEKSVLIAMYGATVGEYGILSKPMTCNQAVCALIPNENYPFTYLFVWTANMKQEFINLATGAAQQNISQDLIKQQYVSGDVDKIKKYDNNVRSIFDKMENNQTQINTLIQTRDGLLERLMSGEIKI